MKRAVYQVSHECFLDILNNRVAMALPPDAEVLDLRVDHMRSIVEILCRSESFEEVTEGALPPIRLDFAVRTK